MASRCGAGVSGTVQYRVGNNATTCHCQQLSQLQKPNQPKTKRKKEAYLSRGHTQEASTSCLQAISVVLLKHSGKLESFHVCPLNGHTCKEALCHICYGCQIWHFLFICDIKAVTGAAQRRGPNCMWHLIEVRKCCSMYSRFTQDVSFRILFNALGCDQLWFEL